MTYEEAAIIDLLRTTPTLFIGRREIARKALGRHAFEDNQRWADAPLARLLASGLVEQNNSGQLRLRRSLEPPQKASLR